MTPRHLEIELPDLRVLPLSSLLLHEQHDAQRSEPLAMRLSSDGILRNPPIVAPIPGESRFVVLDGANRVTALMNLGIPHVVAQVAASQLPVVGAARRLAVDREKRLPEGLAEGENE